MAIIGCLGDIVFEASDSIVRTPGNFQWSGAACYATHQRHLGRGLLEFTGIDPEKISFDMTLTPQLGVIPADEITKLAEYESGGKALPLTIGRKVYGEYRWAILSHIVKARVFDKHGDLYVAVVSITLQEYIRR